MAEAIITLRINYEASKPMPPSEIDRQIKQQLNAVGARLANEGQMSGNMDLTVEGWRQHVEIIHTLGQEHDAAYMAEFKPEAEIRGHIAEIDPPSGSNSSWLVDADELCPDIPWDDKRAHDYYDYLKTSRYAPKWVRDHDGPFSIDLISLSDEA